MSDGYCNCLMNLVHPMDFNCCAAHAAYLPKSVFLGDGVGDDSVDEAWDDRGSGETGRFFTLPTSQLPSLASRSAM
jgi:hypothetical protein